MQTTLTLAAELLRNLGLDAQITDRDHMQAQTVNVEVHRLPAGSIERVTVRAKDVQTRTVFLTRAVDEMPRAIARNVLEALMDQSQDGPRVGLQEAL